MLRTLIIVWSQLPVAEGEAPPHPAIRSAKSFFGLVSSSPSSFNRPASETSMPPHLVFQLYSVIG